MAAVNRLAPLIVRRTGPRAAALPLEWGQSLFGGLGTVTFCRVRAQTGAGGGKSDCPRLAQAVGKVTVPPWLDDLKLFATGWIGGLVFFGTLIG